MEQRDLIKDQIEQLGKVLGKILSGFLGLKSSGETSVGIEISNEQLKNELDIDLSQLLELDKYDLKKYLTSRKLSAEHIEILSKYLEEIGLRKLTENKIEADKYLSKTLILLELVDEISKEMSFERINRKSRIENALQHGA